MSKHLSWVACFLLVAVFLSSCESLFPTPSAAPVPGLINTLIVLTANAASSQTMAALPTATVTPTPSRTPRAVTETPTPTETVIFAVITRTPLTPTLRPPPAGWPDWSTGNVVRMPKGSGENVGTVKLFEVLTYVKVRVSRKNGVKLRQIPSTEAGTNLKAGYETSLILLGYWNKNSGGSYLKVMLPDGSAQYWVGGSGEAEPTLCLDFVR